MLRKAAGTSTFMLRRGREREGVGGGAHNDTEKCWLAVSVFSYLYWQ